MKDKILSAQQNGYSSEEIIHFMQKNRPSLAEPTSKALSAGVSPDEVVQYWVDTPALFDAPAQPSTQTPAQTPVSQAGSATTQRPAEDAWWSNSAMPIPQSQLEKQTATPGTAQQIGEKALKAVGIVGAETAPYALAATAGGLTAGPAGAVLAPALLGGYELARPALQSAGKYVAGDNKALQEALAFPRASDYLMSKALQPTNAAERVLREGANAAASGAGLAKSIVGAVPAVEAAAGFGAGAGAKSAEELGYGPIGQVVGGVAGAGAPLLARPAIRAGGGAVEALIDLFPKSAEKAAARALQQSVPDPAVLAQSLRTAPREFVPGAQRTPLQMMGNPAGPAELAASLAKRTDLANKSAVAANNRAAVSASALGDIARTPAAVEAAKASRKAATSSLREGARENAERVSAFPLSEGRTFEVTTKAKLNIAPVNKRIAEIIESPDGVRPKTQAALQEIRNVLGELAKRPIAGKEGFDQAYAVRTVIDDIARNKMPDKVPMDRHSKGVVRQIVKQFDEQVEAMAPGYKAYMDKFSSMSKPINAMEAAQDIQAKTAGSVIPSDSGKLRAIAPTKFTGAIDALKREPEEYARTFNAKQRRALDQISSEMEDAMRSKSAKFKALTPESIADRGSVAWVLGRLAKDPGDTVALSVMGSKLVDTFRKSSIVESQNVLYKALQEDPSLAIQLLERPTQSNLSKTIRRLAAYTDNVRPRLPKNTAELKSYSGAALSQALARSPTTGEE